MPITITLNHSDEELLQDATDAGFTGVKTIQKTDERGFVDEEVEETLLEFLTKRLMYESPREFFKSVIRNRTERLGTENYNPDGVLEIKLENVEIKIKK